MSRKKEKTEIKKISELKEYLKYEVSQFGEVLWDFSLKDGYYYLVLAKDFEVPKDYYALDCEVFSLARISGVLGKEELKILDIGRRKTTFVKVSKGELDFYRVVLKGGDYLNEYLVKNLNVNYEEAERIKKEKGLKNEIVKKAFHEIMEGLGVDLSGEVLLSGGGARLKGIEEFVEKPLFNDYCEPELNSAFGASLKFVYKDSSPSFRKEEISQKEQRTLALFLGVSTLAFFAYFTLKEPVKKETLKTLNQKKKELFSQKFPDIPPVLVEEQLKSLTKTQKESVLIKFNKAFMKLPQGVKVYRIEYTNGVLKLVGEGNEEIVRRLKPESVKKTPKGTYEFTLVLK
ncbi:putative protein [Aquifex aeolicus VF5]|uniref:Uncharacterized protein n=1 Tax=Aquifex aeolicus (strain VF5) TaxID=224324 RepID=O67697_AQUAE|nr:putative protein [Aquifex aeolicus VF5]